MRRLRSFLAAGTVLSAALLVAGPLDAQGDGARAREIMEEVDRRGRGWGDLEAVLRLEIHREGTVRIRTLDLKTMEGGEEDRMLLVLREPPDLSGTAFLSILGSDGERAQWMYLPSRRRVQRIAGASSSDAFLGSHFRYSDLGTPSLGGYRFRLVREASVAGSPGAVLERTREGDPAGPRERLWVDTSNYRLHRVEYYDEDARLDRTLEVGGYRSVQGFDRPTRLEMTDHDDGGRTVLTWSEVRIGVGLTERDFDPRRIGR